MWVKTGGAIVGTMPLFWCSILIGSSFMLSCHGYNYVTKTLDKFDGQSYETFIKDLRSTLPKSGEKYGMSVLQKTPKDAERFVRVDLKSGNSVVTLALHAPDVYVFGFVAKGVYYYFQDASAFPADDFFKKFDEKHKFQMKKGSYDQLEQRASSAGKKRNRGTIKLGVSALKDAVTQLAENPTAFAPQAESLLVIIQMVSEAARYNHFLEKFKSPTFSSPASVSMISYENNWQALSEQIVLTKDGVFKTPVELQDDNYNPVFVKNVNDKEVKGKLALLKDAK